MYLINNLLIPPGLNIIIGAVGFVLWKFHRKLAKILIIIAFISLWLFSTPLAVMPFLNLLQNQYPVIQIDKLTQPNIPTAIVILGGGSYMNAPEYAHSDTISTSALERLRYGVYLHNKTGFPLLTTGGKLPSARSTESQIMTQIAQDDFKTKVQWQETFSRNTLENAIYTEKVLKKAGIKQIVLVTNAWHMPRAVYVFQQTGLEVIPAPMGYELTHYDSDLMFMLMPTDEALSMSAIVVHELIGMLWYHVLRW